MRRKLHRLTAPVAALLILPGCVSTVTTVVEAPFQIAHAGYRAVVPSQTEKDRRRGKAARKRAEADARAAKQAAKDRRKAERAAAS